MTFPFSFHANFETGTKDAFDSESDAGNRLDFPGPQQLGHDMMAVFPYRGAYCMRVKLGKNSTDAYVEEGVTWAADSTNYVRFEFMIGEDVQIGNDGDLVDIAVLRSASADEGAVTLARIEPAGLAIGLRDASGSVDHYLSVTPGDWLCLELQVDIDAGGGNDGSIVLWNNNDKIKLSGLDQAAGSALRFGALNQTGDFTGHIYFDEIVVDTARLQPDYSAGNLRLNGETMPFFKSGFAFIGGGSIMGVELIDGGSGDCRMKVYDASDVTYAEHMKKAHLATVAANTIDRAQAIGDTPLFEVSHGCYVELSGTNPSGFVRIGKVEDSFWDDDAYLTADDDEDEEA